MDKGYISKRLEKALMLWEDVSFLAGQLSLFGIKRKMRKAVPKEAFVGPIKHHKEFREHVLKDVVSGKYDYERFSSSIKLWMGGLRSLGTLPPALFSWNQHSRRVISLKSDIQTLLSATSLDGITWQDIKLPFKSFILFLEDPIIGKNNVEYDCILFGEIAKHLFGSDTMSRFEFLLLPKTLDEYRPLNRKKISRLVNNGNVSYEKLRDKMVFLTEEIVDQFYITTVAHDGTVMTESVSESVEANFIEEARYLGRSGIGVDQKRLAAMESRNDRDMYLNYSVCDKVQHLFVSICLHLESLEHQSRDVPRKNSNVMVDVNHKMITKPGDVFKITLDHNLSSKNSIVVSEIKRSRASKMKSVHWRRGHWRKIWGSYDSVDAPKIWIRPCLVNKDLLKENSLPLAGMSNVK